MNSYQKALEEREKQHLLRTLPLPPEGIDFYSNDYLGLAKAPELNLAINSIASKRGIQNGSTGSRLLSGNSKYKEDVERSIADYHHAEDSLIYSSGYVANLGLISCLATRETTLFCDELLHASLIDGARLGHAKRVRFQHNNVDDLYDKIRKYEGQKIVVVEAVYSMDGDICPLTEIAEVCKENKALLIVDEAHSMAVFGENGEGLVQELGLEDTVFARIMTYGKAPGIHGAAVVGPKWLKEYQVNFSRSMIFSTAPDDHHFAAIDAMYGCLPKVNIARKKLSANIAYFLNKRGDSNPSWLHSNSQIQSLIVPGNEQVVAFGKRLNEAGINALPIRKPSVAADSERIRFCLHAYNTKEEIDLLFDILNND